MNSALEAPEETIPTKIKTRHLLAPNENVRFLPSRNVRYFAKSDGYIAAIAASRGFIVASRDTAPFEAAGISVINPWEV